LTLITVSILAILATNESSANWKQAMGKRLSKIYTRTGDDGTTGLGDGSRIKKDDVRMELIGTVDEINSLLGLLAVETGKEDSLYEIIFTCQHRLFDLGGELSIPGYTLIKPEHVEYLESCIDRLNKTLPALENFILPGGSKAAATCHLSRSVSRRAERLLVTLSDTQEVNPEALPFLNRLSDLLFVIARSLARKDGAEEVLWNQTY
jgi:cob(I)alamin adenosyltransferase